MTFSPTFVRLSVRPEKWDLGHGARTGSRPKYHFSNGRTDGRRGGHLVAMQTNLTHTLWYWIFSNIQNDYWSNSYAMIEPWRRDGNMPLIKQYIWRPAYRMLANCPDRFIFWFYNVTTQFVFDPNSELSQKAPQLQKAKMRSWCIVNHTKVYASFNGFAIIFQQNKRFDASSSSGNIFSRFFSAFVACPARSLSLSLKP